jgi:Raf kinase inhibitor-like YbhB/YbcL family protein
MNNPLEHTEATRAVDYIQLKVSSTAFGDGEMIPSRYTCDGSNINPPLDIEHIPEEASCLVLIVDDPDAPGGTWVHWIVWNIPLTHHIRENEVHGQEGMNDFKQHRYGGPCPPSGTHRYFFKVYALDSLLDLPADTDKLQLEKTMSEHILAFGELTGLYKRIR